MRGRGRALLVPLLLSVASLAPPTAALAQTPAVAAPAPREAAAGEADAKARFEAGTRSFAAGEYEAAIADFTASYEARPLPDVLINIAHCYERVYQPDRARAYYERFLAEAEPGAPLRPLAEKRLRVLRRLPGSILVEANAGAVVTLTGPDGHRDSAPAPHRFSDLPPGDYHLRTTLADHAPVDEPVTLHPGESQARTHRLLHEVEQLTIFTVPDGARVFVDEKEEGVTPFSRSLETGRARRLRLEAEGYPPYRETIDLTPGRPVYRRIRVPRPRSSGRTELVLASMAYGGFVSASLAVAIGGTKVSTGTGLFVLVPTALAGVGAGFLVSYALTDDNTRPSHAQIITTSTFFGGVSGASLAFGLGLTGDNGKTSTQQDTLALTLLGSGLGLGAGLLAAWKADPSSGDAAMVGSGGLWGGLAGVLLTEAVDFPRSAHDRAFGFMTLGGTSLGVASGVVLARLFEASRAHVAIVDAAGLLGTLLGYGIGYAAGDDTPDPASGDVCPGNSVRRCETGARYALGGMAIGLLTAAILTRTYDRDLPREGALLLGHDGRFAFALPRLRVDLMHPTLRADGTPTFERRATVDLLAGDF